MTNKQAYAGLLERLRLSTLHPFVEGGNTLERVTLNNPDGPEAADTLESYEAEIARLREALSFYAEQWEQAVDAEQTSTGWEGTIGDIEPTAELLADEGEIARQALSSSPSPKGTGE